MNATATAAVHTYSWATPIATQHLPTIDVWTAKQKMSEWLRMPVSLRVRHAWMLPADATRPTIPGRLKQVCDAQQHNEYVCRKPPARRRRPYHGATSTVLPHMNIRPVAALGLVIATITTFDV